MERRDAIVIPTGALRRAALLLVVVAVAVAIGVLLYQQRERLGGAFGRGIGDQVDRSAYQAVFLTAGQVYFGRLAVQDDHFLLTDVFYLGDAQQSAGQPSLGQLVKRGAELHGPRDPMLIPRDKVLFVENMREDSEVVRVIRQFKSGQGASPAPAATARPTPSASR